MAMLSECNCSWEFILESANVDITILIRGSEDELEKIGTGSKNMKANLKNIK